METQDKSDWITGVLISKDKTVLVDLIPPTQKFIRDANKKLYTYTNNILYGVPIYKECTEEYMQQRKIKGDW